VEFYRNVKCEAVIFCKLGVGTPLLDHSSCLWHHWKWPLKLSAVKENVTS